MTPLNVKAWSFASLLRGLGMLLLCVGILWYGYFQARFFIAGPQITLESPTDIAQNERTITVRGLAENITEITLNGKTIHTSETGAFDEVLVLPDGYTIMTIVAEDRYGRTLSLSRTLVYNPSSSNDLTYNH